MHAGWSGDGTGYMTRGASTAASHPSVCQLTTLSDLRAWRMGNGVYMILLAAACPRESMHAAVIALRPQRRLVYLGSGWFTDTYFCGSAV